MNFLSRIARSVKPYTAGEQPGDKRYVKLNTNENPYPPSPRAEAVLRGFDSDSLRRYPKPDADGLREAIAKVEGVAPESVFCSNGSDETLFLAFAAFFDSGRSACFADITYSFYEVFANFFGIPAKIVPLTEDFAMDLAAMQSTDCAGYFIANPNAPTGVGIALREIERFLASVPEKLVVLDEAYMDFFGQSAAKLTKSYENLLVIKTFSKSYSLAGMRCGYAIGNVSLIDGLRRMKDCMNSYPVDSVCAQVCAAAVADTQYRDSTAALVRSERERVRGELIKMGFTVPESAANFLFAKSAQIRGAEVYQKLKEAGVLVRHFEKPRISDYCRITIGTREENDVLITQLKNILS